MALSNFPSQARDPSWERNQETGEGVPRLSPKCSGTCYGRLAPSSPRPPHPGDRLRGGPSPSPPARGPWDVPQPPQPPLPGARPHRAHLLAVRGRALFPQAAPVEQVPRLQVQSAGPRQERPGRAAVGAHGSCRLEGSCGGETGERRGRGGGGLGRRRPRRARCPRPKRRARGCRLRAATARCVRSGPRRPGGDREAVPEGGAGADGRCGFGGHRRQEGAVSWKTMTKQKPKPRKCFVTVTRPAAAQGRGAEGRRGAGPRVTGPRPAAGVAPGERGAGGRRRGECSARKGALCRPERGARPTAPAPPESSRPTGSAPQPMAAALRLSARPLD